MVELQKIRAGYSGSLVIHDVSLAMTPGAVLVILGPNGCGKSTLLRTANGLLPVEGGQVVLDGKPLKEYAPKEIARRIAYLPQSRNVPNITARRLVMHGRFPWLSYPRRYRREDTEAVDLALKWTGAEELADRLLPELSGGQRQKVYLAMALAQQTDTILMDEPTTFLDARHQLEVMDLARRLAREGKAVAMVLHDLCLALQGADRIAVLNEGSLQQEGTPEEIYRSGVLDRVMGVTIRQTETEAGARYYLL